MDYSLIKSSTFNGTISFLNVWAMHDLINLLVTVVHLSTLSLVISYCCFLFLSTVVACVVVTVVVTVVVYVVACVVVYCWCHCCCVCCCVCCCLLLLCVLLSVVYCCLLLCCVCCQVPNMPWRELILHLDYQGFYLPSPEALSLIMTAYNMACREPFPLECVHLAWANPRGQVRGEGWGVGGGVRWGRG